MTDFIKPTYDFNYIILPYDFNYIKPTYDFNYIKYPEYYYNNNIKNSCGCNMKKSKDKKFENKSTQTDKKEKDEDVRREASPLTRQKSISNYNNERGCNMKKSKDKKFENKLTQTDKKEENEIVKREGSPLTRQKSISNYNNERECKKIEKSQIIVKNNFLLVEDVETEIPDFVTVNGKTMSIKDIEQYIFLDGDDERVLCEMPEEYQEMKQVYMKIME